MTATRDQGWSREDIDFDDKGRLVIKNPALVKEIQEVLMRAGKLEITTAPLGPPRPPPPPNMCGCNYTVSNPKDLAGLGSNPTQQTRS